MKAFAQAAEKIAGTTKKLQKTSLVADYFKSRTLEEAGVSAVFLSGRPFPVCEEAILQVGGFLSLGGRLIAISYEALDISPDGQKITLAGASKEAVKSLPEFKFKN